MADEENAPQTAIGSEAPNRRKRCSISTMREPASALAALLGQLDRLYYRRPPGEASPTTRLPSLFAKACALPCPLPGDKSLTPWRLCGLWLAYPLKWRGEPCGRPNPSANARPHWPPLRDWPHRLSSTRCPIGSG